MRVLFDTNIILDVLLRREPWVTEAGYLWQASDEGLLVGYATATTLTDIFYVARRLTDVETAHKAVRICLQAFQICPVDRSTLEYAIALPGEDFEDNLQIACAEILSLDAIVTRNPKDFQATTIRVATPPEILAQLS